jgi:hypothetical protein
MQAVASMRMGWTCQEKHSTNLKATIMWPLLETGFAFSRYAVKLSSRQRTSGCVEPGGNDGERGEFGGACDAVATMPHIGQPLFGANAM